ncbi:MAG: DUF418 domain-containing protein [Prevotella sp.]|nr:DUF418 domain-containing protein [Prevotella sp.]
MQSQGPTTERERHLVLDLLRGLALMGIALANYPEFALWTFLAPEQQAAMPTAAVDRVVRFLQYLFVDGKFYTIFSLLFGIGFSLILARHGRRLFLRRMLILVAIGLVHLLFIWNGDILTLYALGGLLLTLFTPLSDRRLLLLALALILLPVGLDALTEFRGVDFAGPFYQQWWRVADARGITEQNFATWLRDATDYPTMYAFLQQGACERLWEFVEGHRLPKVLGLFILGYLIGRHRLYARLREIPMKPTFFASAIVGFPLSVAYAWSAVTDKPWGLTAHSLLYALSVVPMALAYVCAVCLVLLRWPEARLFKLIAAPGRMALSCYIGQSLIGILLFYGVGFGLGTTFGLIHAELVALAAFLVEVVLSRLWLLRFRFGPLEWLWRMLTYGRCFPLAK